MAKTLIINGANFFANKLAVVSFNSIPCEEIEFSTQTINIVGISTYEISYTLTPSDTTDEVEWNSSDTDVVTVSDGVLSVEGIGSATVTAVCGEVSASATVTVTIPYTLYYAGGNSISINSNDPNFLQTGTSASRCVFGGTGNQATEYQAQPSTGATALHGIKLPKGTKRIKLSVTDGSGFYNGNNTTIFWAADEHSGYSEYPDSIKPKTSEAGYNMRTSSTLTFNVPNDGTNSVYVMIRAASAPNSWPAFIENSGFNIEFLLREQ